MSTETRVPESGRPDGATEHIIVKERHCEGKPHIAGHRIKVQHVAVWHERAGKSADEIASTYRLTLGEVYAALSYYWDHKDQIDADIEDDRAFADQLRAGGESILEKARRRHAADNPLPS
jgi:uncharacterized protein (DUF433 family)